MNLADTQSKIADFFKTSGLHTGEISFVFDENTNTLWCSLETPDARLYLGREGEGLSALNHIVRKIIEKDLQ